MGRIGQIHAQTVFQERSANLVAIYDPYVENIKQLADRYQTEVADYNSILENKNIQAVLICTPTSYHAHQIEDCAMAHKAIFCEKPIDLSVERASQCLDKVARYQGRLMVGFNRRFDPNFCVLKKQLENRAIGQVELIQITSRDPNPPPIEYIKNSGGLFKDMMIHDIDMVRFLTNDDLHAVQVHGANLIDHDIGKAGDIDTAIFQCKTKSDTLVSITNSRRTTYGYDQRIEIHGEKGMLCANNVHQHSVMQATYSGLNIAPYQDFFIQRYQQAYKNIISYFIHAVLHNLPLYPSGYDGLKALQIAQKASDLLLPK